MSDGLFGWTTVRWNNGEWEPGEREELWGWLAFLFLMAAFVGGLYCIAADVMGTQGNRKQAETVGIEETATPE